MSQLLSHTMCCKINYHVITGVALAIVISSTAPCNCSLCHHQNISRQMRHGVDVRKSTFDRHMKFVGSSHESRVSNRIINFKRLYHCLVWALHLRELRIIAMNPIMAMTFYHGSLGLSMRCFRWNPRFIAHSPGHHVLHETVMIDPVADSSLPVPASDGPETMRSDEGCRPLQLTSAMASWLLMWLIIKMAACTFPVSPKWLRLTSVLFTLRCICP